MDICTVKIDRESNKELDRLKYKYRLISKREVILKLLDFRKKYLRLKKLIKESQNANE